MLTASHCLAGSKSAGKILYGAYALCCFRTTSVAFLGEWMPVPPVQCDWFEYQIHICAVVTGVRLHSFYHVVVEHAS